MGFIWYHLGMDLIRRDTDYAVRAILYVVKAGKEVVSTAELQRELKLPRPFMRKIFQTLQRKGILKSLKGNRGGFVLAKTPQEISLLTLMRIFQGKFSLAECLFKKRICPNRKLCVVRKKVKNIESLVLRELEGITIKELLKKEE